jgi:hypothetical protein
VSDPPDRRRYESEEPSPPRDVGGAPSPTPPGRATRRWLGRVAYFCLDLLGIAGWTWLAIALPLPVFNEFLSLKNTIAAFVAVVWVGRTIVDTLFYDRYP